MMSVAQSYIVSSQDEEAFVEVKISGEVFKAEAGLLSSVSEFFTEEIEGYKLLHGGRAPPTITIEGDHSPADFLPLLRYMKYKKIDTVARQNPNVMRLAKQLRINSFLDRSTERQYAILRVMHPKREWFAGQKTAGIWDGRQPVVQIDYGSDKPMFTSFVDGLNWVYRNGFIVSTCEILSKDASIVNPYLASLTLSKVIDPRFSRDETEENKEFALLMSKHGSDGASVILDMGDEEWDATVEGYIVDEFAPVATDMWDFKGPVNAMNWLGRRGFEEEKNSLERLIQVIREVLVREGLAPQFISLCLWCRMVKDERTSDKLQGEDLSEAVRSRSSLRSRVNRNDRR